MCAGAKPASLFGASADDKKKDKPAAGSEQIKLEQQQQQQHGSHYGCHLTS
jgi:hypothetical protein